MKTTGGETQRRAPRRRALAAGGSLVACLALGATLLADETAQVEGARTALEKYVEVRRVISQEKRDWALGKELLDDRIELVQREITSLEERITEAKDSIAEADRKREDLIQERDELDVAATALRETVQALEERTRNLIQRLPDPIRERVKPLSQRLPEDSADTKLRLWERFQNIAGILNEVNKFNSEITVTSEVRTLASGDSAEVTALYVGLGQAYYVTANEMAAGRGFSTPEGWSWTDESAYAEAIALAIAIQKAEEAAEFVQLPVDVQ